MNQLKHIIIIIAVLLVIFCSSTRGTNHDEAATVAAGLSIWRSGQFDVYCVNPPLVKVMAALPGGPVL